MIVPCHGKSQLSAEASQACAAPRTISLKLDPMPQTQVSLNQERGSDAAVCGSV